MFRAVEWPLAKFIWMQIFLTEKIALEHNSFNLGHRKKSKGVPKSPPILKRGPSRCKCDHFCLVARVPFLLKTFPPPAFAAGDIRAGWKIKWNGFHPVDGGNFLLLQQISICAWSSRGGRKKEPRCRSECLISFGAQWGVIETRPSHRTAWQLKEKEI